MEEQRGRGSGNKDDKRKRIYSSLLFLSMLEEIIHETPSHPFLELIPYIFSTRDYWVFWMLVPDCVPGDPRVRNGPREGL